MNTKHTPGPWRVGTDDRSIFTVRGTTSAGMQHSATAAGCASLNDADLRANARLIAAAPELAEALLCVIACLSQPVQSTDIGDDVRRLRGAVNILRVDAAGARKAAEAALRKAGILEDA